MHWQQLPSIIFLVFPVISPNLEVSEQTAVSKQGKLRLRSWAITKYFIHKNYMVYSSYHSASGWLARLTRSLCEVVADICKQKQILWNFLKICEHENTELPAVFPHQIENYLLSNCGTESCKYQNICWKIMFHLTRIHENLYGTNGK